MSRITSLLSAILLVFGVSMSCAAEESATPAAPLTKIGVVDLQQLLTKSPQAEESAKRLEGEFQKRKEGLIEKQKNFQAKQEKFQRDREVLSLTEVKKSENELMRMQQDLRRLDEEFRADYSARTREEMDEFIKVVLEVVGKFAQEEHYDLIIPQDATFFAGKSSDVTDKVMQRLSSKASAKKANAKTDKKADKADKADKTEKAKS